MTGLIVVDLFERLVANRIFHRLQQEGTQGTVQGNFQHRHHRAQHIHRHVIAVTIQPFNHQTQIDVGLGNFITLKHAPALHQCHLGIGMALFFRMKVGVDLA